MVHLIDKDALVAEIEKLKGQLLYGSCSSQISMQTYCKEEAYNEVLSCLDTLEVREVDLESNSFDATVCKIGSIYLKEMDRDAIAKALESYKNGDKVKVIIKAQKGE